MLSVRFPSDREWWVSGKLFHRLFQNALDSGDLSVALEEWRHIADANGGIGLDDEKDPAACRVALGLRSAAQREIEALGVVDPQSEDGGYRSSLLKLLNESAAFETGRRPGLQNAN